MSNMIKKTITALLLVLALMLGISALAESSPYTSLPVYSPVMLEAASVTPIPYDEPTPYAPHKDCYLPDKAGYLDPSLSVRVEMMRAYDTDIMLVWVQIADASQLRTATWQPYPSKSIATADRIAKRNQAVLAINGDFFVDRTVGYIVRNGAVLRTKGNQKYDSLIIDEKGDFHIIQDATNDKMEAFEGKIIQAFTFGPGLVIDGVKNDDMYMELCGPTKPTQRIVLCQMDSLSYLIATTEGPENPGSRGLTLAEMTDLVYSLGAVNAYNLDGGSSSSVELDYKKINALSSKKFRPVGDIVYFVTAIPE